MIATVSRTKAEHHIKTSLGEFHYEEKQFCGFDPGNYWRCVLRTGYVHDLAAGVGDVPTGYPDMRMRRTN